MNPIALLFGLILLAVSVFFVASPLRFGEPPKRAGARGLSQNGDAKLSPEKRRQAVLLALRDLDFDYQAGKVAEEDYQTLRVELLTEAAQLMQDQERLKDDALEALIQSRRRARIEPQPAPKAKDVKIQEKVCQHCQSPLISDAKFCPKCGTPVGETVCPKCKKSLQPGDRFCPSCGTAIDSEKQSTETAARPESG
jgi:RNA polymerase subunit RPABC4/transcription elongation factor Spt4